MPLTRKTSPEREIRLGRELPVHPDPTPEVQRWYEDFKNNLQRDFQLIEDALRKLQGVTSETVVQNVTNNVPAGRFLVYDSDVAPEAKVQESKLALNFPTHSNANDPSEKEKQALAGTYGTPSGSNPYVTNSDPRLKAELPSVPVGMMMPYAGDAPPESWMICDGAILSREVYADLFGAIGELWGAGDGSTTFSIPDLRGRTLVAAGTGAGLTARAVGDMLGVEAHTLTGAQSGLPQHNHTIPWRDNTCSAGSDNDTGDANGSPVTTVDTSDAGPTDASQAHPNMQPSAVCLYVIKVA